METTEPSASNKSKNFQHFLEEGQIRGSLSAAEVRLNIQGALQALLQTVEGSQGNY